MSQNNTQYTATAYIALGSNLDNPHKQINSACEEIDALPGMSLIQHSSLYQSAPIAQQVQPDYINAVAKIDTALMPAELLNALLIIERKHGRKRTFRNAPRTLDLDILLYNTLQLNSENLTIPHPRMTQRAFVLYPLMEIAPDCCIPGHGKINQLIAACSNQIITRLDFS
ncbi:2-amino-4-hydroxy-6-hydroxymethyldihydropteridinediphosphokinase [Nitrosomonas sp. Nm51]|uniref:2-amino-4-hydroxy-6- hydroxymethyldihydropteridine diphosphokinase n=1 Tax=Nitrosomonas sp. Nm51 TaxID=133720 RepID=UPI0008D4A7D4|nr:2-amino-4-hydroxy-6-hydroxymethyldihydropteridine diphosphokinase [Nitrosomonas sp. Nm51]SER29412.1 2-amino-4-hydroxy-6-hydroxymethyldihydropteridinediphosphokinase [Nitrosomonas sp. Nm51]